MCNSNKQVYVYNAYQNLVFYPVLDVPPHLNMHAVIGIVLDISKGYLDGIERSFPSNTFWCCNKMLETWLEIDTNYMLLGEN